MAALFSDRNKLSKVRYTAPTLKTKLNLLGHCHIIRWPTLLSSLHLCHGSIIVGVHWI